MTRCVLDKQMVPLLTQHSLSRDLLYSKDAQIFLISGSGTLGWDQVASNLIEPGEEVLVLNSGYFGDSFRDWYVNILTGHRFIKFERISEWLYFFSLEAYGAKVDSIIAEFGTAVTKSELEKALKAKKYKAVTFTHVDTSTGELVYILRGVFS